MIVSSPQILPLPPPQKDFLILDSKLTSQKQIYHPRGSGSNTEVDMFDLGKLEEPIRRKKNTASIESFHSDGCQLPVSFILSRFHKPLLFLHPKKFLPPFTKKLFLKDTFSWQSNQFTLKKVKEFQGRYTLLSCLSFVH